MLTTIVGTAAAFAALACAYSSGKRLLTGDGSWLDAELIAVMAITGLLAAVVMEWRSRRHDPDRLSDLPRR